jgi:hypothetical protein
MHSLAISLIGLGVAAFNCSAVLLLLLDRRKRGLNARSFQENLDEIDRQVARARRALTI